MRDLEYLKDLETFKPELQEEEPEEDTQEDGWVPTGGPEDQSEPTKEPEPEKELIEEPEYIEYTSVWKLILMFIFGVAVAIGVLFLLFSNGLIPGVIIITFHEQQINQTFNEAYDMGVYDTSESIIQTKEVPVFTARADGTFEITYKQIEELI